jgi:tetratricopeptide (TPR) repeat protein
MRKYWLFIVAFASIFSFIAVLQNAYLPKKITVKDTVISRPAGALISQAMKLLKFRKDSEALAQFEQILLEEPLNLDGLWGRAEILRRRRHYQAAAALLNQVLAAKPRHVPSLISLANIKYKEDNLEDARALINQVLSSGAGSKDNAALAYLMLGTIDTKHIPESWLFGKIKYATQIKTYFLKARELAPDLPEARLALGTFYYLAPVIVGGSLDKAVAELELAVKLAPDFATANARLAQCYKKKGLLEKYNFHLARAKELDPENEVLRENE